jgi:hypothetical protein
MTYACVASNGQVRARQPAEHNALAVERLNQASMLDLVSREFPAA